MKLKISKKISAVMIATVLMISGFGLYTTLNSIPEATAGSMPLVFCSPLTLQDPLNVHVVATASGFRTTIIEKEVFICDDGFENTFVRQIAIIITKDQKFGGFVLNTSFQVITCDKELLFTLGVSCTTTTPGTTFTPEFLECLDTTTQQYVEMDSDGFGFDIGFGPQVQVLNTIVEKEILECTFGVTAPQNRLVDVFTVEELRSLGSSPTIETFYCEKDVFSGVVIACDTSPPPTEPPQ